MAKLTRKLTASYIYTSGTLVQVYDEQRGGINVGQTADITLGFCKVYLLERGEHVEQATEGRIIIDRYQSPGLLSLIREGKIRATMPCLAMGSENSRRMGVNVQHVQVTTARGLTFDWTEATGIMSGNFTLQNDAWIRQDLPETVTPGDRWGMGTVWAVRDLRKLQAVA